MIDETRIVGVARSSDGKEVYYEASDPKASYVLTNETDRSAWEWVDSSKIDYNYLPKPGSELQNTLIANHGLPLSFLQIQTVEEGAEWYKANSKYPDLVCEMMAKYEWGDLRYKTKKEFKNQRKKRERKKPTTALVIKKGPVLVHFSN